MQRDAPALRRREARPPGGPHANLGPRQRLPREPERDAASGLTGSPSDKPAARIGRSHYWQQLEDRMALTLGILALVEAKPGKEAQVEAFVKGGRDIVEQEPGTRVWYGFRVDDSTFGIFDAFEDEAARSGPPERTDPCGAGYGRPRAPRQGSRTFAWWTCWPSRANSRGAPCSSASLPRGRGSVAPP